MDLRGEEKMKYVKTIKNDYSQDFVLNLLKERGIIPEELTQYPVWYKSPEKTNLCDPLDLDNMEKGFEVFKKHLFNGNRIRFYVDSDVDGFTSSAIFINYINKYLLPIFPEVSVSYRLPVEKEHGLKTVMDELLNEKICDLIVLPDSSSNDYEEHRILSSMGYDILVLDHHDADKYSENAVVINNQLSSQYVNKSASGVGVVYKFLQYCDLMFNIPNAADTFLDLVALGEISDMMVMQNPENRYICKTGLLNINNPLFRELVKKQCYQIFGISPLAFNEDYFKSGKITQIDVAFSITPLINALIRVGSSHEKELLFRGFIEGCTRVQSTKKGAKGTTETIAEQVARYCVNARQRQNKEKDKAIELLDIQISDNCLDKNKILILNADDLDVPNTLTGLIAMGVAAKYKKPTMLGRISSDGYLKGSIRGREESPLKDFKGFLKDSSYMEFVEGHPNAAGFSLKSTDVDKLYDYANSQLENMNFNEGFYEADFVVSGNYSKLERLIMDIGSNTEFWGQGCKEPLIAVENIVIPKTAF